MDQSKRVIGGFAIPKVNNKKRQSVTTRIEGIYMNEKGEYRLRELTEEEQKRKALLLDLITMSETVRIGSASTIAQQDMILRQFRAFMIFKHGNTLPSEAPNIHDESIDEYIFNQPAEMLLLDLRFAIMSWMETMHTRSIYDTRPNITGAMKRRTALLRWIILKRKPVLPWNKFHAFAELGKTIYTGAKQIWEKIDSDNTFSQPVMTKVYFGRHELRHLLDYEYFHSKSRELSEQHELAWCLGAICGLRPCSIVGTTVRTDVQTNSSRHGHGLKWRDVDIYRSPRYPESNESHVKFDMILSIEFLKTNGEPSLKDGGHRKDVLRLTIRSSDTNENLVISPQIRMLAILLRRKAIVGIETIDQLLDPTSPMRIRIKDHFLNKPIFIAGTPSGRGLASDGRQLRGGNLQQFFKKRALAAGFPESTSFYAWRRGAATTIDRATCRDKVRAVLAHEANGNTFEKHYDNRTFDIDVFAIAAGETQVDVSQVGQSILHRVQYDIKPETEASILQAVVENDVDYKSEVDPKKRKIIAKRLRRHGLRSLRDVMRAKQKETMTVQQFRKRMKDMQNDPGHLFSEITRRVAERKQEIVDDGGPQHDYQEDRYEDIGERLQLAFEDDDIPDDYTTSGPALIQSEIGIGDSDELVADDGDNTNGNEPNDNGAEDGNSFATHVRCILEWLLDGKSHPDQPQMVRSDGGVRCLLCDTDDTVDASKKAKLYTRSSVLLHHQAGMFHTPYYQWLRKMKQAKRPNERYACPHPDCPIDRDWDGLELLAAHIKEFALSSDQDAHAMSIRQDGWADDDFFGDEKVLARSAKRKAHDQQVNIAATETVQLKYIKTSGSMHQYLVGEDLTKELSTDDASVTNINTGVELKHRYINNFKMTQVLAQNMLQLDRGLNDNVADISSIHDFSDAESAMKVFMASKTWE